MTDIVVTDADFREFQKIPRLSRECVVTEKIDGTNAQVFVADDLSFVLAGSRNRWITPEKDNFGFAAWVRDNEEQLKKLGPGRHFGEWWGCGIQRKYGMSEKVFSLFDVHKWSLDSVRPECCRVVPVLYTGIFDTGIISGEMTMLKEHGSQAAPGFMNPEGIIIRHSCGHAYKKTFENDDGKWRDSVSNVAR